MFPRFVFLCNRWLAVEEDDGFVDRLIPVALQEDLSKFGNIFFSDTRKRLTDSHLWISIFSRPNKSNFSRVQRLSTVFSLLMMTMLASAMFYRIEDNIRNVQGYSLGPFKFTLQEVYVSVVTSLLVFPATLLIDQLFRKSRPKSRQKANAFENERPSSAISRWSLKFSSVLRVNTRTQVTPIPPDNLSDSVPQATKSKPSLFVADSLLTGKSETTPPPSPATSNMAPRVTYHDSIDTPVPAFARTLRASPSLDEPTHHDTPAPPLFLKYNNDTNAIYDKYKPNLRLSYINSASIQISSTFEHMTPIPSTSGQLPLKLSIPSTVSPKPQCDTPSADSTFSFDTSVSDEIENIVADTPSPKGVPIFNRKLTLPHWCVYIAWFLVFLTSAVSATLTFLYSIEWGKEKSIAWLTSMLLAIVESVSLIQPAKVCLN